MPVIIANCKKLYLRRISPVMLTALISFAVVLPGQAAPLNYGDVAPILFRSCVMCHAEKGMMGGPPEGFRLDSYEETISAADRVRVVPGNALASELYRRVVGHARPRMPFNGPPYLAEEEIQRLAQWIDDGALDASGNPAPSVAGAKIRLFGNINKLWQLDGLILKTDSQTKISSHIGIGSYVRVDGRISADGKTIIAGKIKKRK